MCAGQAASEHADPAVDARGLDPGENFDCDDRQPETDKEALYQVIAHKHWIGKEE